MGRGFSWLTLSIVAGKLLGGVTQLLLGRWISDEQFGDIAIMLSIAAVVKVFQDGGVPQVLVQRGAEAFDRTMGAAFWLSMALATVSAAALAVAAPIIADVYDTPMLTSLLWVVAASLPLGGISTFLRAKLRVDLRFKTIAYVAMAWFVIRNISTIGLASAGFGTMSLAIPLVIVAIYEAFADYYATRIKPWRLPFGFSQWPDLLGSSFWVGAAAVSRGVARMGDYLALGIFLPMGVVGKYFFGYQFTAQVLELLATNLQHVLFPALSRLADQPERQARAIVRSIRMLVFIAAPVSVCLAVVISPLVTILDEIVWNHKWSSTIGLMQIFAVTAPMRMFTDLLAAALSSQGKFRSSAIVYSCEGLWLVVAASIAVAIYGENLVGLAVLISLAQAVFSVGASIRMLRDFGIDWQSCLRSMLPAWFVALAAGGGTLALLALLPAGSAQLVLLICGGCFFGVTFIAMARVFLAADLMELAGLAPAKIGRLARALLLLPSPPLAYDRASK
ncbi:hypothetical protein PLANPX_0983 [Lacipirellula parvula]|uniref:Polysaccharide biosynthesis protein C-terminal domain-containing protein n=1 Tax=Lacipirellula parvula TaxID=2650471 RepID=A0A5K7X9D1_9BACT|nr:hypothetical protein PLANPX_0983 [Lacipirellula parvula]